MKAIKRRYAARSIIKRNFGFSLSKNAPIGVDGGLYRSGAFAYNTQERAKEPMMMTRLRPVIVKYAERRKVSKRKYAKRRVSDSPRGMKTFGTKLARTKRTKCDSISAEAAAAAAINAVVRFREITDRGMW